MLKVNEKLWLLEAHLSTSKPINNYTEPCVSHLLSIVVGIPFST